MAALKDLSVSVKDMTKQMQPYNDKSWIRESNNMKQMVNQIKSKLYTNNYDSNGGANKKKDD